MAKKPKGHSKKTRHPGVGVSARGKHGTSKTNVTGHTKQTPKGAKISCPTEGCKGGLSWYTIVLSSGKQRQTLLCKQCDLPILEKWWL